MIMLCAPLTAEEKKRYGDLQGLRAGVTTDAPKFLDFPGRHIQ